MKYTPLIIKNNSGTATGQPKVWNKLGNVEIVIKSIPAAAVVNKKENNSSTGKIISGIPTPWARATIFKYALQEVDDGLSEGLKNFYSKIKTEWRSLIAFIALHSEDIKVEKIELNGNVSNPSNFKARLGSMLFEEKVLWNNPNSSLDGNPPYIQLIKYKVDKNKYVTIGATSPYTVVFTPPKVRTKNQRLTKFIKRGEWVEPTRCDLDDKELQKIYDTVTYIREHLSHFNEIINKKVKASNLKLNSASLDTMLKKYQQDLKRHSNGNIKDFNIFNAPKNFFQAPFDVLFNAEAKLYQEDGWFYRNKKGEAAFKVEDFLAPSKNAVEIIFKEKEGEDPLRNTAHLLEIKLKDKDGRPVNRYFAIPLSDIGIIFFQNKLDLLLDESTDIKHQLKGIIENSPNGAGKRLKVELTIEYYTGNAENPNEKDTTTVEKSYELPKGVKLHEERIIVWPNFVSNDWKKYYLYSDLPHNLKDNEVKAFPLLGTVNDNNSITLQQDYKKLDYIKLKNSTGEKTNIESVSIPVKNSINSKSHNLNYEIYESEIPFLGIELRVGIKEQQVAGYLITKSLEKSNNNFKLEYFNPKESTLGTATVGIDFGSNNTCISYRANEEDSDIPKLITIRNRRRFFMGSERFNDKNIVANAMELFFFNKTETTGQLKSMLIAHEITRLANTNDSNKQAVRGGFAAIEKNLPINVNRNSNEEKGLSDYQYELDVESTIVHAIHNMKWSRDDTMNNYKYSFLKTLWLQTNAELYRISLKPNLLCWAYPSAMDSNLKGKYKVMWSKVVDSIKFPYIGDIKIKGLTEGSAVAKYAISKNDKGKGSVLNVGLNTMGIGYDVGGSTTDILIIIKKKGKSSPVLAKQSSILLAAQYLSKAIKKSNKIRDALKKFLAYENINIHGIENMNENNAPYFLNAIFDRLSDKELRNLYDDLFTKNEMELFAISAYISGLILYYTGQLTARVILEEEVQVTNITKGFYGKGGNVFNWITTILPEESKEYYQECFFAGLGKTKELDKKIEDLKKKSDISNSGTNSTKNINALKAELKILKKFYNKYPDDATKNQIEDLKIQIAILAEAPQGQDGVDIPILKMRKKVIDNELKTLNEDVETLKHLKRSVPDVITNQIDKFQEELNSINSILEKENQKTNNEEKLKSLESIQNVNIVKDLKYQTIPSENKNEVSYGLSSTINIDKLDDDKAIPEIIGEEGYTFNGKPLNFTDVITEEYLKEIGGKFKYPNEFKKLEEFTDIYSRFISDNGILNIGNLKDSVKNLSTSHFEAYVRNLSHFKSAMEEQDKKKKPFNFKTPIIILEGMCLLDEIILKKLL